jgi:glycosyltransferase 2 family protein
MTTLSRAEGHAERRSPRRRSLTSRPWWPWLKRVATLVFFVLIAALLISEARAVDWSQVFETMRRTSAPVLATAAALAACSHLLFSCFDLLGRRYTGHRLRTRTVMAVNFISYAFNLNLGALVGGVAFRYRLYTRLGLKISDITRVLSLSMLTNWLGYVALGAIVLLRWPLEWSDDFRLHARAVQLIGALMLAVVLGYLAACAFVRRRTWAVYGHKWTLPSLRLAALQLLMSCSNWMLMAGLLHVLLQQRVTYHEVLGALLAAAVAGVITHVPAGLGVLEAVFVALLSGQVPKEQLLGVLLIYRALYYLAPLLVATLMYLLLEARLKKQQPPKEAARPAPSG